MPDNKIFYIAVTGFFITAAQSLYIFLSGDAACLNEGCSVVESMILISPLPFNLLGSCYFLGLSLSSFLEKRQPLFKFFLETGLWAGLAAEGCLLAFQAVVAKTFCSYCLIIFSLIFLMNCLRGLRHFFTGVLIACVQAGIFIVLQPGSLESGISNNQLSLNSGTFAVKTCDQVSRRLYLIFSEKCPHCQNVLNTLKGCSKCEVHFNPIARVSQTTLPGLETVEDFQPEVNKRALKLLNIHSIPVLVVQTSDGFRFIKGDSAIIQFIEKECFSSIDPFSQSDSCDPFFKEKDQVPESGCGLEQEVCSGGY